MSKTQVIDRIEQLPFGKLLAFAVKQGWAALFGGLMLLAIIVTGYVDLPYLSRYDWLFIFAILIQVFMLVTKLEKPHEVITIVLFHLVGLAMELFKTSDQIGSWSYPGEAFFMLGNVPLFSGFMYAAVGSYIARSWRVLELDFSNYPRRFWTLLLAIAIYVNFFTHHFFFDIRYLLFAAVAILYYRTWVSYRVNGTVRRMPLLVGFVLISLFVWLAENIGTYTNAWLYPNQMFGWELVGFEKMGSWLLLMIISFIMVDLLHYIRNKKNKKVRVRRRFSEPPMITFISANLVIGAATAWAIFFNANDPVGYTYFWTLPIYATTWLVLLLDSIIFALLVGSMKKGERKRRVYVVLLMLSTSLVFTPVFYSFAAYRIDDMARDRSTNPVSRQEARGLIESCKVETMYRQGATTLYLHERGFALPGMRERAESRVFAKEHFDEMLALARSAEVEDRCGYVPVYDIERASLPQTQKWINEDEAGKIIASCFWPTMLYLDSAYYHDEGRPGADSRGIYLRQRYEVWNEEVASVVVLYGVDSGIVERLKGRALSCDNHAYFESAGTVIFN